MYFFKKSFFLLSIFFLFELSASVTQKDILLIHSYHRGYKWSDDISKVIDKNFDNRDDVSLTTVYMDTKKVATPLYFDRLFELYDERFRNRGFDLIIAADNNALEFVIRYHEHLFKDLPVVFLGINNFDEAMIYENNMRSYTTGVVEAVDIKKNIDLILNLHPKLKKILIINDHSRTGFAIKRDIFKVLPIYKNRVEFEYVDNMKISNLKNKVTNLSKDTAILWVLLFQDKAGKYFTYKESLEEVREISNTPIYGLWDFYLGEGIVGGVLTSAASQAESASIMVEDLLKGVNPRTVPILTKSPNKYMFDYNELQKYKIQIPSSIKNYEIINKPFSFYETYKKLVWATIGTLFIITIILILLTINVRRRKKTELALTNQLKFIGVLMDTIPNPLNYKDLDGVYIGCNKAFADFFNKNKEEIIGKTVFDFFQKDSALKHLQKDAMLLDTHGTANFEETFHFSDGRSRVVSYNKTVYENIDGSIGGIVSVMDDITKRIQQEQFMIQQSKLAEMGEMVEAIAHQWNEPLVELSAILQDMEFSYVQDEMNEKNMKEFVNESMVQIQYMSHTLKDFRNFLKPSTKKAIFCAKKALDDVLEILGKQIFYSHIKLTVSCSNKSINAYGYESEFKQVLLNIINNAKKKILSAKKGNNINISIKSIKDYAQIRISDNGGAIPGDIIGLIFDAYFTTNKDGTGLGLYMAKVIIEDKMNGKIQVYNDKEVVTFDIIVPSKEMKI
ncbi:ABC transporter substrate binding protein [Sulfurimonas sp.]|uniref:sensor histidine kinase n=1 Tax=Sulfurimonas sp. TaxID=2022749 RepID=UPI002B466FE9|nr:ABC transporter substrate binding protein [Sulfurimonas sp.]